MSTASDRRAPGATRIQFDAMVEVGGALGPSFEAQSVNLSEEGMHLRTAYLPEVGQPVTCRFDAGHGLTVVATGEVLWNEPMGDGGEFGIRFMNLDAPSTAALQRILGMAEDGGLPPRQAGRKVRLHIEGLASPMRARVKDAQGGHVTAFSELGFLQVGKGLELEDAITGDKRPASIDRVAVEIEQESRIPQLVVSMRYEDEQAAMAMAPAAHAPHAPGGMSGMDDDETGERSTPEPHVMDEGGAHAAEQPDVDTDIDHDDMSQPVMHTAKAVAPEGDGSIDEESSKLKGAFARSAAKITPALEGWAKRAKTTIALLAAKRKGGSGDDVEIPVRRMTAPPPDGALHASGRKVVRGEIGEESKGEAVEAKAPFKITKKKAAIGGAVAIASILAIVAVQKPAAPVAAPVATAPTAAEPAAPAAPAPVTPAPAPASDPLANAAMSMPADEVSASDKGGKPGKVTPFGSGSVGAHANVLKIKMDGAIEKIQGASQPTGFTVVIPSRKSLDAAGPLAAKDPRIAAIRVANEASGAELTVTFKDGVPGYQVRAKKDTLEIALAKPVAEAKASAPSTHKKHGKKHH